MAATELLNRRKARRNLLDFTTYTKPDYYPDKAHVDLAAALERVERGECKRLIVNIPRRHGKSELSCIRFPTWYVGRNPGKNVCVTGYALGIALKHSTRAKAVYRSRRYRNVFPDMPERLEHDSGEFWGTPDKWSYTAVGVGGPVTGTGINLAVIDDTVKNRAEAESKTYRDNVTDWYKSVLRLALEPDAAIVLTQNRWHPQDLPGWLIDQMNSGDGEKWEVISMKAVQDDGSALCPTRFPLSELEQIRIAVGSYEWSTQYLQEPRIRGGNVIQIDGICRHQNETDPGPCGMKWTDARHARAWDLASTAKQRTSDDPDYSVGLLGAVTHHGRIPHLWLHSAVWGQKEKPERDRMMTQAIEMDGASVQQVIENYGAYKDSYIDMKQTMSGRFTVKGSRLPGNKLVKAGPLEPIYEAGNVHVLRGAWNGIYEQQTADFTGAENASHDDFVDCQAILYHHFCKGVGAIAVR